MDINAIETVWEYLGSETRPIFLYGMGDGAEKILSVCAQYHIHITGIFASDAFVRGHFFAGFRVLKLSEVLEQYGEDIVIVICFGSARPDVLEKLYTLEQRFSVVAPDVPVVAGGALFDREFCRNNKDGLKRAYDLMTDDQSRTVFRQIVRYKLTGRIEELRVCETQKNEAFHEILQPTQAECFLDLGAYNGDTIQELLSYTAGRFSSITALEPDPKNFKKLSGYLAGLSGKVLALQNGVWEKDGERIFAAKAGRNSKFADSGRRTVVRSVDSVLGGEPCTLLKMDVEGAEAEALCGARDTIARYAPRLNVACYHRSEDLFALPLLIHELNPAYHVFLRHHPYVPAWDTNLYVR